MTNTIMYLFRVINSSWKASFDCTGRKEYTVKISFKPSNDPLSTQRFDIFTFPLSCVAGNMFARVWLCNE